MCNKRTKEKETNEILGTVMTDNLPKLMMKSKPQIQEAQKPLRKSKRQS